MTLLVLALVSATATAANRARVATDATGSLGTALLLPAACYAVIAAFGIFARRPSTDPLL